MVTILYTSINVYILTRILFITRSPIFVSDTPKFDCGAYRPTAVIGKPYSLSCIVTASPPITSANILWEKDGKQNSKGKSDFKAEIIAVVKK